MTLKLLILHLVNQYILDQELGQILLDITCIQVLGSTSIKNKNLFMDQFINRNWFFYTLEDTSASCQRQFLKDLSIVCHKNYPCFYGN